MKITIENPDGLNAAQIRAWLDGLGGRLPDHAVLKGRVRLNGTLLGVSAVVEDEPESEDELIPWSEGRHSGV